MIVDEYFLKGIDLIKQRSFVPTAVASTFFLYSGQLFLGQSLGHFSLLLSKTDGGLLGHSAVSESPTREPSIFESVSHSPATLGHSATFKITCVCHSPLDSPLLQC